MMTKAAVFTMKLEADLRNDFMAAAEATHRPASQVVRELMREFILRQQDHATFVERKVAAARLSADDGHGQSATEVELEFADRRSRLAGKA
jgi:predicted transcriptional regulator